MSSCLWLERPGKWRAVGLAVIFLFIVLPAAPLVRQALASGDSFSVGVGFSSALLNSAAVALLVVVVAAVLGLPAGILAALYDFPGRRLGLMVATLPLLVPSFLWAIGWSALAARLGTAVSQALEGVAGCVLVFAAAAFGLVLFTSYTAAASLAGSQVDAARLAGGEWVVFRSACRHAAVPAGLAAGLAGVLTLSDAGPGQILGLRTAASEILTSFAARYDFPLAGRQCLALALLVLLVAAPLLILAAPRLAAEMLARQVRTVRRHSLGPGVGIVFLVVVLAGTLASIAGLILPLLGGTAFQRAGQVVARTGGNTLLYALGAAVVATMLGFLLGLCVGRNYHLRTVAVGLCLAFFALPPALAALGIIQFAAAAPAWADPLLRSRLTVCLALGLRFFPVAAVLGIYAWSSMPSSWALAAAIHGVPVGTYLRKVVAPALFPSAAVALLLVALLATAEVGSVLLLHPPGERSLPLAIFTVMANAPESLVASLCLVYLAGAAGLLTVAWALARRPQQ
jgi:iron(III) transport system permease protein